MFAFLSGYVRGQAQMKEPQQPDHRSQNHDLCQRPATQCSPKKTGMWNIRTTCCIDVFQNPPIKPVHISSYICSKTMRVGLKLMGFQNGPRWSALHVPVPGPCVRCNASWVSDRLTSASCESECNACSPWMWIGLAPERQSTECWVQLFDILPEESWNCFHCSCGPILPSFTRASRQTFVKSFWEAYTKHASVY